MSFYYLPNSAIREFGHFRYRRSSWTFIFEEIGVGRPFFFLLWFFWFFFIFSVFFLVFFFLFISRFLSSRYHSNADLLFFLFLDFLQLFINIRFYAIFRCLIRMLAFIIPYRCIICINIILGYN